MNKVCQSGHELSNTCVHGFFSRQLRVMVATRLWDKPRNLHFYGAQGTQGALHVGFASLLLTIQSAG